MEDEASDDEDSERGVSTSRPEPSDAGVVALGLKFRAVEGLGLQVI